MDIRYYSFEYLAALIQQKMEEGFRPMYQGYRLYFVK